MRNGILLALFALFFVSYTGFSQEPFQAGQKYIQVSVEKSPTIAGGYFLSSNTALHVGFSFRANGEISSTGLGIQLGMDKYLQNKDLTPFMGGTLKFEINPVAYGGSFWEGSRITLNGYWGLNYFPFKNLSLAGRVGGELQINSPKFLEDSINLGTFTSSVEIRFYFR